MIIKLRLYHFNKKDLMINGQGLVSKVLKAISTDRIVRSGAAYLLNNDMQIDVSISNNFKDTYSALWWSWILFALRR
jgi:hypothetical protein